MRSISAIFAALLLVACATGSLDDRHRDTGSSGGRDIGSVRDTGGGRDIGRPIDTGTGRDVPVVDTTPDDVIAADTDDATLTDTVADTAPDTSTGGYDDYVWPAIEMTHPALVSTLEASRAARIRYCTCCGGGEPTCPSTTFIGAFPNNSCAEGVVSALGATDVDPFLTCMTAVFGNLQVGLQGNPCGSLCASAEQNFTTDIGLCSAPRQNVADAMAGCL